MKTTIGVRQMINSDFALSADAGDKVFAAIDQALRQGHDVTLDLSGIENATTVFLNAAVGRLVGSYKADELRQRVDVVHANQLVGRMFRLVTRNAKRYFENREAAELRDELLLADG